MEESAGSKDTPTPRQKQADVMKRRYPDLAQDLEKLEKEPLLHVEMPIWREIRILLAAKLYGADRMSSERAAKLAGLPHVEFLLNLGFYKVFPLQAELSELERQHD
jgi:hypothetical protein